MMQINIPDAIQLEPMKKLSFYFSAPVPGMLHLVIQVVPAGQYNHAYSTCYFDANFQVATPYSPLSSPIFHLTLVVILVPTIKHSPSWSPRSKIVQGLYDILAEQKFVQVCMV